MSTIPCVGGGGSSGGGDAGGTGDGGGGVSSSSVRSKKADISYHKPQLGVPYLPPTIPA